MNDKELILDYLKKLSEEDFNKIEVCFYFRLEQKSVRLCNAIRSTSGFLGFCRYYLFDDPNKLLSFRNFGRKSLLDFLDIKDNLIEWLKSAALFELIDSSKSSETSSTSLSEVIDALPTEIVPKNKKILEFSLLPNELQNLLINKIDFFLNSQSVRITNRLKRIPHKKFIDDYVIGSNNPIKIDGLGKKSAEEIIPFIDNLRKDVDFYLQNLDDNSLDTDYSSNECVEIVNTINIEELVRNNYKIQFDSVYDTFVDEFYSANSRLPLFYMFSKSFKENLSLREIQIFCWRNPVLSYIEEISFDKIATKLDISRTRIGQINDSLSKTFLYTFKNKKVNSTLLAKFQSLFFLILDSDSSFYQNYFSNRDIINAYDIESILSDESSELSHIFALKVLKYFLYQDFTFFTIPSFDNNESGHSYLINNSIFSIFDFNSFIKYFKEYINNCTDSIKFKLEDLIVSDFIHLWVNFDVSKMDKIVEVLHLILIQSFGLIIDPLDNSYTIEVTKTIRVSDLIYDIISDYGQPMKINDIFAKVSETFGDRYNIGNIRSYVQRDERIGAVGRNSTYALKEWSHIKFGSIRDIIVEFLSSYDEPKHISEIVDYVNCYYDTNEKNIRSTMQSGSQFVVFENGYFGLSDKVYDESFKEESTRISFEEHLRQLEEFIISKKRFPFSSGDDLNEYSLYVWWRRTVADSKNNAEKKIEVDRILSTYNKIPSDKKSYNNFCLFEEYKKFFRENNRKPSTTARIKSEQRLANWFNSLESRFEDDRLNSSEEEYYITLCNLV